MKDKNKIKIIIILSLIFFIILILNCLTPIISDDFGYSFNLDKERLSSIKDIINFQIVHYKMWGGRSVAHTLVQLFLMLPKTIFNICNSIVFTILIYLTYYLSKNKDKPIELLLIFLLIYFITPVLGQDILWLTGSCNYLFTTTIILFFLSCYKKNDIKDNKISILFIFIIGIISGWTNENTSFGLITILTLFLINKRIEKQTISKWQISGLIGNIIGFLILILSPGNYIRKDTYNEEIALLNKLLNNFITCTKGLYNNYLIILIIFIILISIYIYKNKKINIDSIIYMIGSIISIYSMILSPAFPERSWFGIIVFGIISIMILVNDLIEEKIYYYILIDIVLILSLLFIPDYIKLVKSTNELRVVWKDRIDYINNKKIDKYKFKIYKTDNKKNPIYGQIDLEYNSTNWPNTDIERYYNVKEIIGT